MHVMARGVRKTPIFLDEDDFKLFMTIVEAVKKEIPFEIYAFCLMTNHFHMLIKTEETEVWHIMRRILSDYARTFNRKYGFSGHLFDSRYASKVVRDDRYLLEVSRYIHLNPVKAGMVRSPMAYCHSSYNVYIGRESIPLVNPEVIQGLFFGDPVEEYRGFVEDAISHEEMESKIQKDMKEDDQWLPY